MPATKSFHDIQLGPFLSDDFSPQPEELTTFFKCLGFDLPNDYSDFLNIINGGYLYTSHTFKLKRSDRTVKEFYPFAPASVVGQPFTWIYNNAIRPAALFEIAEDDSGNYICIWTGSHEEQDEANGEVWHIDSSITGLDATSDYDELTKNRKATKLADSFISFIKGLSH
jgi:hypothetical protein